MGGGKNGSDEGEEGDVQEAVDDQKDPDRARQTEELEKDHQLRFVFSGLLKIFVLSDVNSGESEQNGVPHARQNEWNEKGDDILDNGLHETDSGAITHVTRDEFRDDKIQGYDNNGEGVAEDKVAHTNLFPALLFDRPQSSKADEHVIATCEHTATQAQPKVVQQHAREHAGEGSFGHGITDGVRQLHADQRKGHDHHHDAWHGSQIRYKQINTKQHNHCQNADDVQNRGQAIKRLDKG